MPIRTECLQFHQQVSPISEGSQSKCIGQINDHCCNVCTTQVVLSLLRAVNHVHGQGSQGHSSSLSILGHPWQASITKKKTKAFLLPRVSGSYLQIQAVYKVSGAQCSGQIIFVAQDQQRDCGQAWPGQQLMQFCARILQGLVV